MAEIATGKLDRGRHLVEYTQLLEARARCAFREDPRTALPIYEELFAQDTARYGADSMLVIERRSMLAEIDRLVGRADEARAHEAAVDQLMTTYIGDRDAAAQTLVRRAHVAFMSGYVDHAIELQRKGTELLRSLPDGEQLRADALRTLATYYEVKVAWRLAAQAHGDALAALEHLPETSANSQLRAESHAFRGSVRLELGDAKQALDDFQRALELADGARTEILAIAQLGLGRAWLALDEPQRALRFLREGLASHAKLGAEVERFRIGVAELALAKALWAVGDKQGSRATAKQAETSVAAGIDESRQDPRGRYGRAFHQAQLDEIVRWRDAHR